MNSLAGLLSGTIKWLAENMLRHLLSTLKWLKYDLFGYGCGDVGCLAMALADGIICCLFDTLNCIAFDLPWRWCLAYSILICRFTCSELSHLFGRGGLFGWFSWFWFLFVCFGLFVCLFSAVHSRKCMSYNLLTGMCTCWVGIVSNTHPFPFSLHTRQHFNNQTQLQKQIYAITVGR